MGMCDQRVPSSLSALGHSNMPAAAPTYELTPLLSTHKVLDYHAMRGGGGVFCLFNRQAPRPGADHQKHPADHSDLVPTALSVTIALGNSQDVISYTLLTCFEC